MITVNKYITASELAIKLKKSTPTIARHISSLIKSNRIRRVGSNKTGYYEIIR